MTSKAFIVVLVLACLIAQTISKQNGNSKDNQLEGNGDVKRTKANGQDSQVTAKPSAIDPITNEKCCPKVMKPIVLTAKPRYKYVVVPPVSVA